MKVSRKLIEFSKYELLGLHRELLKLFGQFTGEMEKDYPWLKQLLRLLEDDTS